MDAVRCVAVTPETNTLLRNVLAFLPFLTCFTYSNLITFHHLHHFSIKIPFALRPSSIPSLLQLRSAGCYEPLGQRI